MFGSQYERASNEYLISTLDLSIVFHDSENVMVDRFSSEEHL
jgi:hypothetical protein